MTSHITSGQRIQWRIPKTEDWRLLTYWCGSIYGFQNNFKANLFLFAQTDLRSSSIVQQTDQIQIGRKLCALPGRNRKPKWFDLCTWQEAHKEFLMSTDRKLLALNTENISRFIGALTDHYNFNFIFPRSGSERCDKLEENLENFLYQWPGIYVEGKYTSRQLQKATHRLI